MNKMCEMCKNDCKTNDKTWTGCIYKKQEDNELDRLTKRFYKDALKEYRWRMTLKNYDENEALKDTKLTVLCMLNGYDQNISLDTALAVTQNISNIVWHNEFLVKYGFTNDVIEI